MTTLEQFKRAAEQANANTSEPEFKEYKLMYYFGTWITNCKLYAENDQEAIYDADRCVKIANDKLNYALWCGNRKVKEYNNK